MSSVSRERQQNNDRVRVESNYAQPGMLRIISEEDFRANFLTDTVRYM